VFVIIFSLFLLLFMWQDHDGEVIKVSLIMKFCASTFNFPLRFNNFARTCSKLWAMLAKKSFDLWKPKNQIAIV
jgi:glycerol kinase